MRLVSKRRIIVCEGALSIPRCWCAAFGTWRSTSFLVLGRFLLFRRFFALSLFVPSTYTGVHTTSEKQSLRYSMIHDRTRSNWLKLPVIEILKSENNGRYDYANQNDDENATDALYWNAVVLCMGSWTRHLLKGYYYSNDNYPETNEIYRSTLII